MGYVEPLKREASDKTGLPNNTVERAVDGQSSTTRPTIGVAMLSQTISVVRGLSTGTLPNTFGISLVNYVQYNASVTHSYLGYGIIHRVALKDLSKFAVLGSVYSPPNEEPR